MDNKNKAMGSTSFQKNHMSNDMDKVNPEDSQIKDCGVDHLTCRKATEKSRCDRPHGHTGDHHCGSCGGDFKGT